MQKVAGSIELLHHDTSRPPVRARNDDGRPGDAGRPPRGDLTALPITRSRAPVYGSQRTASLESFSGIAHRARQEADGHALELGIVLDRAVMAAGDDDELGR